MSLVTNISNFALRAATEDKAIRTLLNGNAADLTALTTTNKSNLVAALNELKAAIASASSISDSTTSTRTTWSSSKITSSINAATAALVANSPAALDTLKELADALGNDANFAASTATALGNRLRLDATQTLTGTQQAQGRTNLDVFSKAEVGDVTTDFVAAYVAGLA